MPVILRNPPALIVAMCLSVGPMVRPACAADPEPGEQVYRQKCASCHGAAGEGTPVEYPFALAGDRSLFELAQFITAEMPKDAPGECVGEDAQRVAAYIYDAFYSLDAQARKNPPKVQLARLTVRQYTNALADLVGSFRSAAAWERGGGLQAQYFKSKRMRGQEVIVDRVDPIVDFNFGETSPLADKIDVAEFSIRWQGSLLAEQTGEYEFNFKTENAGRLWVGDDDRPLVDALVRSGSDMDHRGTIWLLGGRAYPLRLEFNKSKEKTASVALLWKRPHAAEELIPERCLSSKGVGVTYAPQMPFPPDDRSLGYERGNSVSKQWDEATTEAAIATAGYVVAHLSELADVRDSADDRAARLREFCGRFAERAFRRPLSPDEKQFFVERRFAGASDPQIPVKQVVVLVLKSPRFLYREPGPRAADAHELAARLSFGLWDSLPDKQLLEAAAGGQLMNWDVANQQAQRMVLDQRATLKLREFFLQWLRMDQVLELTKDSKAFADFDAAVASDLRTSLELFLDDVISGGGSDFRRLFSEQEVYLNGRLANFYGVDLPIESPFQKIPLNPDQRAGILSHPYLMAQFAYGATSSPIHRGVFVARSVLGRSLRPPPEAVVPLPPELNAELTTRQRIELQTSAKACQACHAMVNPLGFALEQFDAVGRYRIEEAGKPIDAKGQYLTRTGQTVTFEGVPQLGRFLVASPEVQAAFVQHLFHYLIKQPIRGFGVQTPADLQNSFVKSGFNIRQLAVDIVLSSALENPLARSTTTGQAATGQAAPPGSQQ